VQLTPNDAEKIVYIRNDLSGGRAITLFQGTYNASNDYEVPAGTTAVVFFNGGGAGAVAANVFNNAFFDSLRLGGVSVTAILDEDNMASDSATALATQQSIKAYVDAQVGANNELSEILANGNTSGGTNIQMTTTDEVQFRDTALKISSSVDGQLDIAADVELEIVAPTLDINASTAVTIDTTTMTMTGSVNVVGDLDVDNLNINGNSIISTNTDGNIALTPNGTGEVDISKVDIDGGTIDGTVIGGSTPAAISGTTGSFSGDVSVADKIVHTGDTDTFIGFLPNRIYSDVGGSRLFDLQGGTSELNSTGAVEFNTGASLLRRLNIANNGDISFYEDTGTTPKFFWDASAESLGIGTTSPSVGKLQVNDSSGAIVAITRTSAATSGNLGVIRFGNTNVDSNLANITAIQDGSNTSAALTFETQATGAATAERMRITSSGELTLRNSSNNVVIGNAVTGGMFLGGGSSNTNLMVFQIGSERMRIDSAGLVGIGTSSPAQNLHILAGAQGPIARFSGAEADRGLQIETVAINGNVDAGIVFKNLRSTGGTFIFQQDSTERMRIDSAGNVGIGTSSPSQPLEVAGNIAQTATTHTIFTNNIGIVSSAADLSIASGSANLVLKTGAGNTERARIDASGNLLVGTTTTIDGNSGSNDGVTLRQAGRIVVSANEDRALELRRRTTNGQIAQFFRDTTQVGNISVTTTATAYNTSSDYRLKEDVQPMVGSVDRLMALKPVNFAWKVDGSRVDGFLAHEAQEVVPQAVTGEKDGEEMQAIDHSKLVPLLTAALQEALTKIEALEARLNALEGQ
jgi:hypothetical protein